MIYVIVMYGFIWEIMVYLCINTIFLIFILSLLIFHIIITMFGFTTYEYLKSSK